MPPKTSSLDTKLAAIRDYLAESGTCFTIKELENKASYGRVKIRGAEIKSLIKNLTDEGMVQCEKIGTGNWYWTPWTDAGAQKKRAVQDFTNEKKKREDSVAAIQADVAKKERLLADTPVLIERAAQYSVDLEKSRELFALLEKKLAAVKTSDSMALVDEKNKTLPDLEARIERWEDNLEILKSYVTKMMGGDASVVNDFIRSIQGPGEEEEAEASEPEAKRRKTT